jgi:hypothetical protein
MVNTDSITATPYQLTNWNITYTPVAEGAIAPNLYNTIPDTLYTASPLPGQLPGMLHIGVGFKNVSQYNFDTLHLNVVLYDSAGGYITYPLTTLRKLAAGDTMHIDEDIDVSMLDGWYNLYLFVNPNKMQPEQFSFNNFLYKYIYIRNGTTLSIDRVDFNATAEGKTVKTWWKIADESKLTEYEIEHSKNGMLFNKLGSVQATNKREYTFVHTTPQKGRNYYRLRLKQIDGKQEFSSTKTVDFNNNGIIKVYPNPVHDQLYINTNNAHDITAEVKIFNSSGQYIFVQKITGVKAIDTKNWAAGLYLIQVTDTTSATQQTFKVYKQ